jgi:SAM-dependent methyltransferase
MSVQSRYPKPLVDQRQFFDELITEEWASYKSDAWDFSRRFEISRLFRKLRPARILDIGCGCGFHDSEMAEYDFVTTVDAIDYSAQSIKKADEAYPHAKVSRRVADLAIDPPGGLYDLVVSFQVFEHLSEPDVYFRFAKAACRPGGTIAIVTPNADRLDNRILRWRGQAPVFVDPQHFREYNLDGLRELGRQQGLVPSGHFGYGLQSLIYPNLSSKDYRRRTQWGALLPRVANVIGVLFEKPRA